MIAILESPEIRQRTLPISVETYHWMIENGMVARRAELIRGVIVEKMSKSSLHSLLAKRLYDQLMRTLGPGWYVRKEDPLTLRDSEPEPDILVVEGVEEDFRDRHPHTAVLVVEIAVSSEASDREMIKAYAEAGVSECWLVLARKKEVVCYSSPSAGAYQVIRHAGMEDTLTSAILTEVSLSVASLFQ
jgi:Uma2 family endonuclease